MSRWSSRVARRVAVAPVVALVLASSGRAHGLCPNCLGQARTLTARQELLGLFMLVPFAVAWLAARLIRRFASSRP